MKTKKKPSPPVVNIALVDLALHGIDGEAIRGIQKFGATRGWNFHFAYNEKLFHEVQVNRDALAGVIVSAKDTKRSEILRKMNLPVVNISNDFPDDDGFPAVLPDEEAIASQAVDHLVKLGFRNFALSPFPMQYRERCFRERGIAFAREVQRRGFLCTGLEVNENVIPQLDARYIDGFRLFKKIEEPLAIFCCNDHIGERWLFLARHFRRRVPESIAVLGCGNFDLICQMANPPLSSVRIQGEEIGYRAARMLAQLIAGQSLPWREWVPPNGIEVRQSSNIIAVQNRPLAKALQFIFDHAHEPITAQLVVQAAGINRRELERNFREFLNRTILEQIYYERIKRARRMLEDNTESIADIAELSGFQDHSHLCRVFKRYGHPPPATVRKQTHRKT